MILPNQQLVLAKESGDIPAAEHLKLRLEALFFAWYEERGARLYGQILTEIRRYSGPLDFAGARAILRQAGAASAFELQPERSRLVQELVRQILLAGAGSLDYSEALLQAPSDRALPLQQMILAAATDWTAHLGYRSSPSVPRPVKWPLPAAMQEYRDGHFVPAATEGLQRVLGLGEAAPRYFSAAADAFAYRWYSMGALAAAAAAGIEELQYLNNPPAGPDARTTPLCRSLHGRRFTVSVSSESALEYLQSISRYGHGFTNSAFVPADAEWPASLGPPGLGIPPFHPRCRTIIAKV